MNSATADRVSKLSGIAALLLACCAAISPAPAATVLVLDNLATDFRGQSTAVHAIRTIHLDFSGLDDLARDQPIQLTLSATAPLRWFGGFYMGAAGFSLQHDALLQITAGAHSISASYSWRFPETGFIDSNVPPSQTGGNIVGFTTGPVPDDLTLIVPWGTDLSDIQITLVEDSAVTGAGSSIAFQSSIAFNGQSSGAPIGSAPSLSVQSVPEPHAAALLACALAAAAGRRRRTRTA